MFHFWGFLSSKRWSESANRKALLAALPLLLHFILISWLRVGVSSLSVSFPPKHSFGLFSSRNRLLLGLCVCLYPWGWIKKESSPLHPPALTPCLLSWVYPRGDGRGSWDRGVQGAGMGDRSFDTLLTKTQHSAAVLCCGCLYFKTSATLV